MNVQSVIKRIKILNKNVDDDDATYDDEEERRDILPHSLDAMAKYIFFVCSYLTSPSVQSESKIFFISLLLLGFFFARIVVPSKEVITLRSPLVFVKIRGKNLLKLEFKERLFVLLVLISVYFFVYICVFSSHLLSHIRSIVVTFSRIDKFLMGSINVLTSEQRRGRHVNVC